MLKLRAWLSALRRTFLKDRPPDTRPAPTPPPPESLESKRRRSLSWLPFVF